MNRQAKGIAIEKNRQHLHYRTQIRNKEAISQQATVITIEMNHQHPHQRTLTQTRSKAAANRWSSQNL
jgi:hypothetical protein